MKPLEKEFPCRFDRIFVGGKFLEPDNGDLIDSFNPATGAIWTRIPNASREDVDRAVIAAKGALRSAEWGRITGTQRARLMNEFARLIELNAETLANIESTDNGKPITLCRGDVAGASAWLRYYAGLADKIHGEYVPLSPTEWAYTVIEPLGVIAAIIPWNSPLLLASWKISPALAAGNSIILKPSELASASCLYLAELSLQAGIPAGVINVLPGLGSQTGEALVAHPDIAKISFTGSDQTAKHICDNPATSLKSKTLECGGKAPFIVFKDADLDDAAEKAVQGMFVNAGQQCTVASRVLIEKSVYDDFTARYLSKVKNVRTGDPSEPSTLVGPIISTKQLDRVNSYIQVARNEKVSFLTGNDTYQPEDPSLENGYWVAPTVLSAVKADSQVYQDEIFGPVVLLQPFDDEDEAVSLANSVRYGLVSGVFTNDIRRAHRVAERLAAGIVWVNTYRKITPGFPYGGVKQSGMGSENGLKALLAYTRSKSVVVDRRIEA